MSVKERLKIYLKSINSSVKAFESSLNVANGYVNSISKSIGIDKIELIIEKYPNLDIEWLLIGKGEMLKTNITTEAVQENSGIDYKELAEARKETIESQKETITTLKDKNILLEKNSEKSEKQIAFLESELARLKQELANATRQGGNRAAG
ncbi:MULTISPECIES: hypothetical protein [Flavobacterium]|uniref:hypothetical protein n=1 Tax=Flavobacterium TaxID=237 RepID=UPI000B4D7347|nr:MULTISPECIES: hypothetical protein [Flavobacterium]OWP85669.1 hypothetical protein BWK60_12865 [Flavobacterium covae]